MKIAFATQDLKRVDAHFGWAKNIAIYEVSARRASLSRGGASSPATCRRTATRTSWRPKIEAIKDCAILYVAAIGGSGAARVVAQNIHPIKVNQPEEIASICWTKLAGRS